MGLDDFALERVDSSIAFLLAMQLARGDKAVVHNRLHLRDDFSARRVEFAHASGRRAALGAKLFHHLEDWLDAIVVTTLDRAKHGGFVDFSSADFDHVDAVLVAREHKVEIGEFHLRLRWIDNEAFTLLGDDATNAHGGDWPEVGRIGEIERAACGGAGDDICIVLTVVAHDPGLQLDFVAETLRKQRTDRTIHHAHREHFLLIWLAFALAESAWELARGARLLAVVASEWEEVDAHARICANAGSEDDGVSVGGHDGAAGELGDAASLEAECATADKFLNEMNSHKFLLKVPRPFAAVDASCVWVWE